MSANAARTILSFPQFRSLPPLPAVNWFRIEWRRAAPPEGLY